jgi:hypothetical protein
MSRLVVVDSLDLVPAGGIAGPLRLDATVSARIFTTAVAPLAPGATAAPAPDPAKEEKK